MQRTRTLCQTRMFDVHSHRSQSHHQPHRQRSPGTCSNRIILVQTTHPFAVVPFVYALTDSVEYPPEELDTDFKRKYPPDKFGEEVADNARVWKVYRDEATEDDKTLLNAWNKTLDILLIFVRGSYGTKCGCFADAQ